jgi:hypothetical protein
LRSISGNGRFEVEAAAFHREGGPLAPRSGVEPANSRSDRRQNLVDFVTRILYKYASSKIARDHRFGVEVALGATEHVEVALPCKGQSWPGV